MLGGTSALGPLGRPGLLVLDSLPWPFCCARAHLRHSTCTEAGGLDEQQQQASTCRPSQTCGNVEERKMLFAWVQRALMLQWRLRIAVQIALPRLEAVRQHVSMLM